MVRTYYVGQPVGYLAHRGDPSYGEAEHQPVDRPVALNPKLTRRWFGPIPPPVVDP